MLLNPNSDYTVTTSGSTCYINITSDSPSVNSASTQASENYWILIYPNCTTIRLVVPSSFTNFQVPNGIVASLSPGVRTVCSTQTYGSYSVPMAVSNPIALHTVHFAIPRAAVYADYNRGGASWMVMANSANVGGTWNDRISSVRVAPFTRLTLYQHDNYGGSIRQISTAETYLDQDLTDFNDQTTSLKVEPFVP